MEKGECTNDIFCNSTCFDSLDLVPYANENHRRHENDDDFEIYENTIDQFQEELETLPEVIEYIKQMQIRLRKQKRMLRTMTAVVKYYESKVAWKHEILDKSTQTGRVDEFSQTTPWVISDSQNQNLSLAEQVKEAAESALHNTNFVYEETSGMYYDYSTGYYYDAEQGLYYDGNNGTYYSYNNITGNFQFHSQIDIAKTSDTNIKQYNGVGKRRKKHQERHSQERKKSKSEDNGNETDNEQEKKNIVDNREDGECTDSDTSEEESEDSSSDVCEKLFSDSESAKSYPPCMRIVVKETNLKNLKIGSLFLVTYTGGTLGREGDHAVLIPDINISKHHAKFDFDDGKYRITDFGSRNGTYLNGTRLSVAKCESNPFEIVHGSTLQVGGTVLLCHIHMGHETCGHCEPGLLQETASDKIKTQQNFEKRESHKAGLKRLQRKLCPPGPIAPVATGTAKYQDRAEIRRCTIGSMNENEKTYTASLEEPIPADNKGFKLLSKMGWRQGESLGKDTDGSIEPVRLSDHTGTAGLGTESQVAPPADPATERRNRRWKKAQQRYQALS